MSLKKLIKDIQLLLVLDEAPNEVNAHKCLVVCYIQESDFKNGLAVINKNPSLSE